MAKCKTCGIRGCKTIVSKCGARYDPKPEEIEEVTKKTVRTPRTPKISRTNKIQSFINENEVEETNEY